MKTKKPKKEVNNSSAFSQLIDQVEKEKKRARIVYSVGIVVLALSLFSFLLFSPFEVPAFSQLGDRILGREEIQEEEPEEVEETEVEEIPEEIPEEILEETPEETPIPTPEPKKTYVPTSTPTPTPTPTPVPVPEPKPEEQPRFSCSEEIMQNYVNKMCSNFWYIGEAEASMSTEKKLQLLNECRVVNCSAVSTYPDLLLECERRCQTYVLDEMARLQGYIQTYNSNIQYYSDLLMSCGWTMSEVHELKQTLLNQCKY